MTLVGSSARLVPPEPLCYSTWRTWSALELLYKDPVLEEVEREKVYCVVQSSFLPLFSTLLDVLKEYKTKSMNL